MLFFGEASQENLLNYLKLLDHYAILHLSLSRYRFHSHLSYHKHFVTFYLHCPLYDALLRDLFDKLSAVPGPEITSINNVDADTLCH